MELPVYILAVTALAGVGGTGLGGLAACIMKRSSTRMVSILLGFAAGVMTGVVCFDLLIDAISPANGEGGKLLPVAAGVLAGYSVIGLLNVWIERWSCNGWQNEGKQGETPEERGSLVVAGAVMAAAIALHNLPEGLIIGASFAKDGGGTELARGGLAMAAVIGLHNIPEGMAVAVPLISGGIRRARAVALTATTGAPTVLGALIGYFVGTLGRRALTLALSGASGAMLYVVFGELLPEAQRRCQSGLPALAAVIGILTGMAVVYI